MNTNQDNTRDDMLVKYLLGEANDAEQTEAKNWIAASDENRRYFEGFRSIWEQSKLLASQRPVNEQDAWERLVKRAQQEEIDEQSTPERSRTIPLFQRTWIRAAALLLLFSGLGWTLYTMNNREAEMIVAQSGNTTLTDTLPDGSVAILNKNSSLSYPSEFKGNKRSIVLKGEAFFSVTPDKSKPFVIDANNTSVTVVGTSFNVKTSEARTEVIVETGIVQVAKKQKSVQVLPNQKATVVKDKDEPEMEANSDELYNYYRTKEFVCHATPLYKLVAVLNEAYNVHIVINGNNLRALPLTVTFKDEPLDNILKVIKETLNISVERKGDKIFLNPSNTDAR